MLHIPKCVTEHVYQDYYGLIVNTNRITKKTISKILYKTISKILYGITRNLRKVCFISKIVCKK